MKTLFVLSTLLGVALSTSIITECDSDQCDSDFDRNDGPILFKSRHNISKVANLTSKIKNIHYVPVVGDGTVVMGKTEEAGRYN